MHDIFRNLLCDTEEELPRLFVFVGAYGSGKSEVSVNFARLLRKEFPKRNVLLSDLDIVNPFFRSADAALLLREENIRVITPNYANTNVDAPTFTGESYAIFDDPSYLGVFDIGGEDLGARILSGMHSRFSRIDYRVYMVVNTFRPFTEDASGIVRMAQELEAASRLKISGFVDNTNLLELSTGEMLLASFKILQEASEISGIPVAFISGFGNNLSENAKEFANMGIPLLSMSRSVLYNK